MSTARPHRLPGNPDASARLSSMLRVDHAGEYGAVRIYSGQLAMTKDTAARAQLEHMAGQEQAHLDHFETLMRAQEVRPTLFQPLWHMAAFAMGAVTAWFGPRAAMTCTAAVEEVIDRHYASQIATLPPESALLAETLERFRAEEIEHRDLALAEGGGSHLLSGPLYAVVRACTRMAIAISSRW